MSCNNPAIRAEFGLGRISPVRALASRSSGEALAGRYTDLISATADRSCSVFTRVLLWVFVDRVAIHVARKFRVLHRERNQRLGVPAGIDAGGAVVEGAVGRSSILPTSRTLVGRFFHYGRRAIRGHPVHDEGGVSLVVNRQPARILALLEVR